MAHDDLGWPDNLEAEGFCQLKQVLVAGKYQLGVR